MIRLICNQFFKYLPHSINNEDSFFTFWRDLIKLYYSRLQSLEYFFANAICVAELLRDQRLSCIKVRPKLPEQAGYLYKLSIAFWGTKSSQ